MFWYFAGINFDNRIKCIFDISGLKFDGFVTDLIKLLVYINISVDRLEKINWLIPQSAVIIHTDIILEGNHVLYSLI